MTMTNYVWDPLNDSYLMETDGTGAPTAVYTQEPSHYGGVLSQNRDIEISYFHQDSLGSTRCLTGQSQTVTDTFTYDAWGNEVIRTGLTSTPFSWIGKVGYHFDIATGSYYVRARNYSPSAARWITIDPGIRSLCYEYCDGSPIELVDPNGSIPVPLPQVPGPEPTLSIELAAKPYGGPANSHFPPGPCCGQAYLGIRWKVASSANGWILQHVSRIASVANCDPLVSPNPNCKNCGATDFWEAWQVVDGVVFEGVAKFVSPDQPTAGKRLNDFGETQAMDTFTTQDEGPQTQGSVSVSGRAWFVPNYALKMPPWLRGDSPDAPDSAGGLPTFSGLTPPGISNGLGPALSHSLSVSWNCCKPCEDTPQLRPSIVGVVGGNVFPGEVKRCATAASR